MTELSSQNIQNAYLFWLREYEHRKLDKEILPFLNNKLPSFEDTKGGWLRKVRKALFISTGKMAERLKTTRSGYCKLEKNESIGAVTLNTLAKAAEAMDCELVYALRPKKKVLFSEIIWQALLKESISHHWVKSRPSKVKANALASIAKMKMGESDFRRRQEWSER